MIGETLVDYRDDSRSSLSCLYGECREGGYVTQEPGKNAQWPIFEDFLAGCWLS